MAISEVSPGLRPGIQLMDSSIQNCIGSVQMYSAVELGACAKLQLVFIQPQLLHRSQLRCKVCLFKRVTFGNGWNSRQYAP